MGVFDLIGTTGSGWLTDRYDPRKLLFVYYGLRGLSLMALPFTDFSFYSLSIFAVFYGLDWIATVPPTVRLANEAFGERDAPIVFGWIAAGHQLGAATAAFGAGLVRASRGATSRRSWPGPHRRDGRADVADDRPDAPGGAARREGYAGRATAAGPAPVFPGFFRLCAPCPGRGGGLPICSAGR